jgi:hypothetical protein
MDRDETIKSLIMDLCKNPELHSKLPHLISTFNEVVRNGEMKECNAEKQLGVYNEDTCYEFYQLLTAMFLAYRNALGTFHEIQQGRSQNAGKQNECAKWLWRYSYLLW